LKIFLKNEKFSKKSWFFKFFSRKMTDEILVANALNILSFNVDKWLRGWYSSHDLIWI